MAPLKALLFASSVRPHRMNDRVVQLIKKCLLRKGYSVDLIGKSVKMRNIRHLGVIILALKYVHVADLGVEVKYFP